MNPNICHNCGSDYEYRNGRWICRACGSYKPEELSNEEVTLLYTAFQKLRLAEFDEAEKEFDDILQKYPKNPSGYWGRLMSRYGIKYEVDFDGRMIPTCYATSIESVISDPDYKKALQYADEENRAYYRGQAEYIERVRLEWVEKAKKEKPYDIFICYKDSDLANGIQRTEDSVAAQDLYIHLTNKGYRVFYSHESLRDKVGEKYEPYIFSALSSAKVMLVYGSKPEYITSTWLKNEWTRYEKRLQAGEKDPHSLLVACDGFSPNYLPRVLSSMQCFNANERSFYSDLDDAIERILHKKKEVPVIPPPEPSVNAPAAHPPKTKSKAPILAAVILLIAAAGILLWSFSGGLASKACEHEIVFSPPVEPTCTEKGFKEGQSCALCGEVFLEPEPIEPMGHKSNGAPTCTEPSYCELCHIELEPAFGHKEGPEATCTEAQTCIHCGLELASALGHKPGHEATCTEPLYCAICDEELEPAKGHEYYFDRTEPTCTEGGYTTYTCHCGESYQDEHVPAHGHQPEKEASCTEASYCMHCGELLTPENGHIPGQEATCTDPQFCLICFSEVAPAKGHDYTENVTAPTCTQAGYTTYTCHCGHSYDDDVKNPLGHSPSEKTSCVQASVCLTCGLVMEAATDHTVTAWTVDRALTETTSGFRHGTCDACGETVNEEYEYSRDLYYEDNYDGTYTVYRGSCNDPIIIIPSVHNGKTVTAIGESAFNNFTNLTKLYLPETVKEIKRGAFAYCMNLCYILMPANLVTIGDEAFMGCSSMQSFDIPGTVTSLGNHAFAECEALLRITIPDSVTTLGSSVFNSCNNLKEAVLGNGIQAISQFMFTDCTKLETIVFGTNVKVIGESAFTNCAALHTLSIPDHVTEIEPSAFRRCTSLNNVTVGNGVKTIGEAAFADCSALEFITLGSNVTKIGNEAFYFCIALLEIDIPDSVTEIGNNAFDSCDCLTRVTFGSGVTRIGSNAFSSCRGLSELVLPASLKTLSQSAFNGCSRVTAVTIPATVTNISHYVFAHCTDLSTIIFEGTVAQWNAVSFGLDWHYNTPATKIVCSDGEVTFN